MGKHTPKLSCIGCGKQIPASAGLWCSRCLDSEPRLPSKPPQHDGERAQSKERETA
jgi:hypothetical protein